MTQYQIQSFWPNATPPAWDNWTPAYWKDWRKKLAQYRKEHPQRKFRAIKITMTIRIINTRRKRNVRSIYDL